LVRPGALWTGVTVVDSTGSTNADLARLAGEGAPEGTVLVAEEQVSGRGRLGRTWTVPARAGLTFSVLLRPSVPVSAYGWLPLLVGGAAAAGGGRLGRGGGPPEWPHGPLVGRAELGGVLGGRVGGRVVVGIGLNVLLRDDELPVGTATSLAVEKAACLDRD